MKTSWSSRSAYFKALQTCCFCSIKQKIMYHFEGALFSTRNKNCDPKYQAIAYQNIEFRSSRSKWEYLTSSNKQLFISQT